MSGSIRLTNNWTSFVRILIKETIYDIDFSSLVKYATDSKND